MTPHEFVAKWKDTNLSERSAAQQHFLDLCALFGHPTPAAVDKLGEEFTFERGLTKTGGGQGFADVWKKGFFAWEYKKPNRNLDSALEQLTRYASALENPPLHVACDTQRFKIVTAWTNLVPATHELTLEDLLDPDKRRLLENVFFNPDALRPDVTREKLTRDAAEQFIAIADRLNHRHADPEGVAHFINQLVFCFFAEDVGLLPNIGDREGYFTRLLRNAQKNPANSKRMLDDLFAAMQHGGPHGIEDINHFNGGLFDDRRAFPLDADHLRMLTNLGRLDWDQIDPTIFGTLFERFLDPDRRKQVGAHFTPVEKIMQIVEPVIVRPLSAEWATAKAEIAGLLDGSIPPPKSERGSGRIKPMDAAIGRRERFLERLRGVRVLDPACGSGNFLYVALQQVKDIENRAMLESEALGLPPQALTVGPEIVRGIELGSIAAELARTTIWIGQIQWEIRNGIGVSERPILKKLDNIECRDALVTPASSSPLPAGERVAAQRPGEGQPPEILADGGPTSPLAGEVAQLGPQAHSEAGSGVGHPRRHVESIWPTAEVIIGNPPFLGGKRLRRELGDDYVETLFQVFDGRVPKEADLVTYWFEKARAQISAGEAQRAGLVATNSIRNGASRAVLAAVEQELRIFDAWSDEPWVVEGAAVRVSLVSFGRPYASEATRLNGVISGPISSLLRSEAVDLSGAMRLHQNSGRSFQGTTKGGPFEISGELARSWLAMPRNTNGRPNAEVLRPIVSGGDIVKRREVGWVVDLTGLTQEAAAKFEHPFEHVLRVVRPLRALNRRQLYREKWWIFAEARPSLRAALVNLSRYIAVPKVSQYRLFVWEPSVVLPDNLTIAITRSDDTTFGIVSSKWHVEWSLALGATLEDRPTYTPTTTFETFAFPEGLTPNIPAPDYATDPRAIRIAAAAKALDDARRAWLNPPDLVEIVPEIVPTAAPGEAPVKYPDRILPKSEEAAIALKDRTLTKLYNARPQWLADLHAALDRAVAAAYGWPEDIPTDDALARLLALNLERSAAEPGNPT